MTEEKQRNSIWRVVFRFVDKPKSKERPFVVLIAVGDRIQGFRMTSRSWRDGDIRFYKIKNLDGTGLTEDTWVDLESVFPCRFDMVRRDSAAADQGVSHNVFLHKHKMTVIGFIIA